MIPQSLVAGDLWEWTDSLSDYPAGTWTLVHHFRGPQSFSVTATTDGTNHQSSVAASTTAEYRPGVYDWIARVTSGTDIYTVATGRLTVAPNLATAKYEHRSFWQRVLDELEPVILGRASTDQLSMSIAGRSLQRMSWDELLKVYKHATLTVASERGDTASRYVVSPIRP